MRETHAPGSMRYLPGEYWKECDRCGFDYLRRDLVREARTNLLVCRKCVDEPRPDEDI